MKCEVGWMNAVLTVTLLASAGVAQAQETQAQEAQEGPPLPTLTIHGETVGGEPGPVMIQGGAVGEAGTVAVGEGGAFFENHIELLGFGGRLWWRTARRQSGERSAVQRGRDFGNNTNPVGWQPHYAEDANESVSRQRGPVSQRSHTAGDWPAGGFWQAALLHRDQRSSSGDGVRARTGPESCAANAWRNWNERSDEKWTGRTGQCTGECLLSQFQGIGRSGSQNGIARHADGRRSECGRNPNHANDSSGRDWEREADYDRVGTLVFG